jgi:glyoxylase-like metal-dependent hydrolase (beta-lactamase superfamily II)
MQLTKFTHACVRLDDGERSLVIDPGVFSEVESALDGAGAVLITHEHADHIDADKVRAALTADPRLRLWAPASVAESLTDLGEQVVSVGPGESFEAGGFAVRSFGGQHAVIHPSIPVIANVGYLIDETVYHPGDSFTVPDVSVPVLLVPSHAPWSKVSEVIDFTVSVRAPKTFQIHDSLLTSVGAGMVEGLLQRVSGPFEVEFRHLAPAESISL